MERILQITSGRGPAECCWVVAQVLKILLQETKQLGLKAEVINKTAGDQNRTLISATVQLTGSELDQFMATWIGTVQWIGQSQFRKYHKRKNWFVGVNELSLKASKFDVQDKDIKYDAICSGGPGGQHVNKVSTAIRAIHKPTGTAVVASDSRSQHQNKQKARDRLLSLLKSKEMQDKKESIQQDWQNHNELERGNPIRVFKGSDFKADRDKKKFRDDRKSNKQRINWDELEL